MSENKPQPNKTANSERGGSIGVYKPKPVESEINPKSTDPVDAVPLQKWLKSIDDNLRSIKSMLQFFVILAILAMLLSFCSAINLS